jgi:hypothetical protein
MHCENEGVTFSFTCILLSASSIFPLFASQTNNSSSVNKPVLHSVLTFTTSMKMDNSTHKLVYKKHLI